MSSTLGGSQKKYTAGDDDDTESEEEASLPQNTNFLKMVKYWLGNEKFKADMGPNGVYGACPMQDVCAFMDMCEHLQVYAVDFSGSVLYNEILTGELAGTWESMAMYEALHGLKFRLPKDSVKLEKIIANAYRTELLDPNLVINNAAFLAYKDCLGQADIEELRKHVEFPTGTKKRIL